MTKAVFVMEICIDNRIPTYSGGLGVLSGDMALSFADMGIPATFVTLLPRGGYNGQKLDGTRGQLDSPQPWDPSQLLQRLGPEASVEIGDRSVKVQAWEYRLPGRAETSVLFLDAGMPENDQSVRDATERLYGGDAPQRLIQDIILGVGGYRILKALGREVDIYHLNESHAAFAVVELLRDAGGIEGTRTKCRFTTHTPVAAGNDAFPVSQVEEAFKKYDWVKPASESVNGIVSLSRLAAKYSGITNAVSLKHRAVSVAVVGKDSLTYVTNGVYHLRWVHEELKKLYDAHIPGWREAPSLMARAEEIPSESFGAAHLAAKRLLLEMVALRAGVRLDEGAFTLCAARRFTGYKRNGAILSDPERLRGIAEQKGPIQVILAGKAHPRDEPAKATIADVIRKASQLTAGPGKVKVVVLENYDLEMAKLLVAGSDVWLNTPRRPLEACGTSGMKAGMNGVLNLSVYDGWWLEAGMDGINGWGVGRRTGWDDLSEPVPGEDENDLYAKLSEVIVPLYYSKHEEWTEMAKASVASVGPLFNSYRMVADYTSRVYCAAPRADVFP